MTDTAPAYELAYVEARRALDDQHAVVSELRGRAGVLIAAAAITTSFFGDAALSDGRLGIAGWAAVAAFVLAAVRVVAMLWPLPGWRFAVDARAYIGTYLERPGAEPFELQRIHRDLALHMASSFARNRKHVVSLVRALRTAMLLLVLEIIAWVIALITQGA